MGNGFGKVTALLIHRPKQNEALSASPFDVSNVDFSRIFGAIGGRCVENDGTRHDHGEQESQRKAKGPKGTPLRADYSLNRVHQRCVSPRQTKASRSLR